MVHLITKFKLYNAMYLIQKNNYEERNSLCIIHQYIFLIFQDGLDSKEHGKFLCHSLMSNNFSIQYTFNPIYSLIYPDK